MGSIEVGNLRFSRLLQRKPASTEVMYLMMRHAFDELGYRRYEWKCDSLNAASLAAAKRLGFRFEGIFRNALVAKGNNRDYGVALDHRRRVAGDQGRVRGLAGARQFRRHQQAAAEIGRLKTLLGQPLKNRAAPAARIVLTVLIFPWNAAHGDTT